MFTATTQNVYVSGVADTVAEAMQLLPNPFSTVGGTTSRQASKKQEMYGFEPNKEEYLQENHSRLKLLAFWQLLITGFEVCIGTRLTHALTNIHRCSTFLSDNEQNQMYFGLHWMENYTWGVARRKRRLLSGFSLRTLLNFCSSVACYNILCSDLFRIQKGNDTQPFAKSQSWRDIRGKDNLTFSIHGRQGKEERIFAIQVWKPSVRNTLVESFDLLLRMMKSDPDGDFPYVAQRVIAQHYAQTGEILTLRQVEDELLREEDEKKTIVDRDRHSSDDDHSSDGSNVSEDEGDQSNILG